MSSRTPKGSDGEPADAIEGVALTGLLGANPQSIADAWQQFALDMATQPDLAYQAQLNYQSELARIWFGESEMDVPEDPRFQDPDWDTHPIFKRLRQSYVAWTRSLDDWLANSGLEGIGVGVEVKDDKTGHLQITKDDFKLKVPIEENKVKTNDASITYNWAIDM